MRLFLTVATAASIVCGVVSTTSASNLFDNSAISPGSSTQPTSFLCNSFSTDSSSYSSLSVTLTLSSSSLTSSDDSATGIYLFEDTVTDSVSSLSIPYFCGGALTSFTPASAFTSINTATPVSFALSSLSLAASSRYWLCISSSTRVTPLSWFRQSAPSQVQSVNAEYTYQESVTGVPDVKSNVDVEPFIMTIVASNPTLPATTQPPTTAPPTTAPATTAIPTTDIPTTDIPTTPIPTTSIPTTRIPTTAVTVPTTPVPTTAIPTTPIPTTAMPTTATPTTAIPTTAASYTLADWDFTTLSTNTPTPYNSPPATGGVFKSTSVAAQLGMTNSYPLTNTASSIAYCDISATTLSTVSATVNAWRVRGAAASIVASTGNGWSIHAPQYSQGAEFDFSTVGYDNVMVSVHMYATTQGIRDAQVQFNIDITNAAGWTNIGTSVGNTIVQTSNGDVSAVIDFSSIAGANNNANFGIRVVSAYDSTGNAEVAGAVTYASAALSSGSTVPYNNYSGNWRFIRVTTSGSLLP